MQFALLLLLRQNYYIFIGITKKLQKNSIKKRSFFFVFQNLVIVIELHIPFT